MSVYFDRGLPPTGFLDVLGLGGRNDMQSPDTTNGTAVGLPPHSPLFNHPWLNGSPDWQSH